MCTQEIKITKMLKHSKLMKKKKKKKVIIQITVYIQTPPAVQNN